MKNKLSVILAITVLATSVSSVSAISWNVKSTSRGENASARSEVKVQVSESRDLMLEQREQLRTKLQEGNTEVMQKIGDLHAVRLENRFSLYFTRLTGIHERLGARITAMEGDYGADKLTKAKSLHTQAGTKLAEAKELGAASVTGFQSVEGEGLTAQRQEVFAARDKSRLALSAFKDATKLMKDVAKELRLVIKANRVKPTPAAN